MKTIKLSPSKLTFLWEECRRCFYLDVHDLLKRPSIPMAKIFTTIDNAMKQYYTAKGTMKLSDELPCGHIYLTQKWVESRPIVLPGHVYQPYFRGLFDATLKFDDDSGYALIDFKTSRPTREQIPFYQRQLFAYVYALENPAPEKLSLSPIREMGLLYFTPSEYLDDGGENHLLRGKDHWQSVPRDDEGFMKFIDEVLTVLELPEPPEAGPECQFCKYRELTRESKY